MGKKRVFALILIMALVACATGGISIFVLYEAAMAQQRERLVETVRSRARLMEAVARFDARHSAEDVSGGAFGATLIQVREAHERFRGFGRTGEFTLARREGDQIVFLLRHRHYDLEKPRPVAFSAKLAEPMRRALSGQSGTVVGLDYRGETVLAAYEPVAELNLGVVAKIDLAEVRAPFIRAGAAVAGIAALVILVGAALFLKVSNPLIHRLESQTLEL
ncbi:MAG: PAS domain S-box protein, partial [Planctomycetota bacterium]